MTPLSSRVPGRRGTVAGGATAALVMTLLTFGCSGQRDEVRHALAARFPDGIQRCLPLDDAQVGIHVPLRIHESVTYDPDDLLAPTRHLFVFYSGLADEKLPELAALLLDAGLLTRHVVQATSDIETTSYGPPIFAGGFVHRTDLYHHTIRRFPVVVLTTRIQDPRFRYATIWSTRTVASGRPSFPVRLYDGALPPDDSHYVTPTVSPYGVSLVDAACTAETLSSIDSLQQRDTPGGVTYVVAQVRLDQTPPDFMASPAFRRAAGGADSATLSAPVHAELVFEVGPRGLSYISGSGS